MFFFKRKHKLLETEFFNDFKDYHNHLLPAVDDGVQSLEDSLKVLEHLESLGFREIVLTPHVMEGVNLRSDGVRAAYATLQESYKGPIKFSLASEYMLDSGFDHHLQSGELRYVDDHYLLVETSFYSPPYTLDQMLYEVMSRGITPILAHPERYSYMTKEQYRSLKGLGYRFQLNIMSLSGLYGEPAQERSQYLLEADMYDLVGTDLHNLRAFKSSIAKIKLKSNQIDSLLKLKV